ncbi:MAG: NUDIX hydrolase [Candidatus Omnitrophica bacterium]|nr:NUDIX hydrolase [Candidatus Omnitrophota bacterium]
MDPQWLTWAKRLQAISQTGLTYAKDPFDRERYQEVRQIAAEITAGGSNESVERLLELFGRQEGYATPKVDVRGVVFSHDKILLVKERIDDAWTLPGGWADIGQSPKECVVREVMEESGYVVRALKLLAVYDREKHPHHPPLPFHIYKHFFLCEIVGGEARCSSETSAVDFFSETDLPPLSITRITPEQIHRMFEHYRNPALPCDFD